MLSFYFKFLKNNSHIHKFSGHKFLIGSQENSLIIKKHVIHHHVIRSYVNANSSFQTYRKNTAKKLWKQFTPFLIVPFVIYSLEPTLWQRTNYVDFYLEVTNTIVYCIDCNLILFSKINRISFTLLKVCREFKKKYDILNTLFNNKLLFKAFHNFVYRTWLIRYLGFL